jgi:hypothetical protein
VNHDRCRFRSEELPLAVEHKRELLKRYLANN